MTAKPHLNCSGPDEGEVLVGVLLAAGGDGAVVLDLVEEELGEVAVPVEEGAEAWDPFARRHL